MIDELGRSLFGSLLVELIVVIIAIIVRDDKRKAALILAVGTIIAGAIGFGSQALQFVPSATLPALPLTSTLENSPVIPSLTSTRIDPLNTATLTSTSVLPNTEAPTLTSTAPIPSNTPNESFDEAAFFGQSKNIDGLVVSVSPPDYDSGCGGTLDFEVTLTNETSNPIVLSFNLRDIYLLGNGEDKLSLYGELGAATPRCYGNFNVESLAPNSAIKFGLRTTESLGSFSYLEFAFGENTGRLSGEKWRLDLKANYDIQRTFFGQTVNADGLEVTVDEESYFPGCNGTLGFQVTLRNTTTQPLVIGMRSTNIRLYGDDGDDLSIASELGIQSAECYSGFRLETIQSGETVQIAVRNTSSLSGLSYVDFVFEIDNRLDGLRWRLILPR